MKIAVVTLFPELIESFIQVGIPRKAVAADILQVSAVNPRDFTQDVHRTVDDRPYGGGPGMVMKLEPLRAAISAARGELPGAQVAFMSPQGEKFDQRRAQEFAQLPELILLAGRYEGIDERLIETDIDFEISTGDFVLSGGEVAALTVIDTVTRLLPGALGAVESAEQDSFGSDGDGILDYPHYTRPEMFEGISVPEVLLSGDHQRIAAWRRKQALERTWKRRPELLDTNQFAQHATDEDLKFLEKLRKKHTRQS